VVQRISLVTVVVPEYDPAIDFYVRVVGFRLVSDQPAPQPGAPDKRWVVVAPPGSTETGLLLAQASGVDQTTRIGDQTGGRVFLFLATDDFHADHARMQAAGVTFLEEPRHEPYGWVAVWQDPFGNRWDLLEDREAAASDPPAPRI
jgi:catechol 2,3-dioxygenase-like lactoylglutathione lyase family enzyme